MNQTLRGRLITLEGVDGAGKSTHLQWIESQLSSAGVPVLSTREPGGTPLGETLRELLLSQSMTLETETLLMFAARCEHLRTVIEPALAQGTWVVCDRFTDATYAYQGGGRQLGAQRVTALEQWVHPGFQPDCTFLFDVPLEVARQRLSNGRTLDRFEQEDADFFVRTRTAYHDRAREQAGRFHIIDSTRDIASIREQIAAILLQLQSGGQRPA